jgi:four helix bundle protein
MQNPRKTTNTNAQYQHELKSVEDLEVFKLAHRVTLQVYELTRRIPREELFGVSAQLRRAAASVGANLAEGAGRLGCGKYRQFVGIAKGSAAEASYHLLLARDLGYIPLAEYQPLRADYDRAGKMLTRLSQSLATKQ